jgi:hypothetical protein
LLHAAGRSFVVAFGLGLYLVLAPVDQVAAAAVCAIASASLLFGNREAWQYLGILNTLRLRLGTIRIPAARFHVRECISWVLGYYWSLVLRPPSNSQVDGEVVSRIRSVYRMRMCSGIHDYHVSVPELLNVSTTLAYFLNVSHVSYICLKL